MCTSVQTIIMYYSTYPRRERQQVRGSKSKKFLFVSMSDSSVESMVNVTQESREGEEELMECNGIMLWCRWFLSFIRIVTVCCCCFPLYNIHVIPFYFSSISFSVLNSCPVMSMNS